MHVCTYVNAFLLMTPTRLMKVNNFDPFFTVFETFWTNRLLTPAA